MSDDIKDNVLTLVKEAEPLVDKDLEAVRDGSIRLLQSIIERLEKGEVESVAVALVLPETVGYGYVGCLDHYAMYTSVSSLKLSIEGMLFKTISELE